MFSVYGTERIKGHNKWKVLSDTFSNLDGHILAGKKKYIVMQQLELIRNITHYDEIQ